MAKFLKVLILIIIVCFLPAKVFGFFANPDNRIYSMPFGVQASSPDVRPLILGTPNLDAAQTEPLQNFPAADFSNISSSTPKNNSQPQKMSLAVFIIWPLIILVFIAVFIFLRRKLQE